VTAERVNTATGELVPVSPRAQLAQLAQPFPDLFVERDPQGNSYVSHPTVNEWLLAIVGPFNFTLAEIIRGDVPAVPPNPQGRSDRARNGTPALSGAVVGGVWKLTCEIDGRVISIEEVGDVGDVHNWPNDGIRLKQAASDALKRCAMRLGLGLHLWSGEHYRLGRWLQKDLPKARSDDGRPAEASSSGAPEAGEPSPSPASGSNSQKATS